MGIADLKERLRDVPGIQQLTMQALMGRQNFSFNGIIASVDADATVQEIEDAIRNASAKHLASPEPLRVGSSSGEPEPSVTLVPGPGENQTRTPLPTVNLTETQPMTTPAPGSFAASIRAMMDEARQGVAQARTDGLAKVGEAVGKLNDAKVATAKVAGTMAQTIEDEAASVLSELGQISNDL